MEKRANRSKRVESAAAGAGVSTGAAQRSGVSTGVAQALVDGLTAQMALVDAQGRILWVNRAWRESAQAGGTAARAVCEGANYLDVCDAADPGQAPEAAIIAREIREVVAGRSREFTMEYPCHSATQQRWFLAHVTAFHGEGPGSAVISHEAITSRVQGQEAMRQEKELTERLIDTVQTIVLLLSPEGRIIRCNRCLEALTGWPVAEMLGKDWFEQFIPKREQDRIRRLFQRAMGGEPTRGNVNAIVTKSGREVEIEWRDAVLRSADGKVIGLLCSGRDITERKRAEDALRRSEERLAYALEAGTDGLWDWNIKTGEVYFSPRWLQLLGYSPGEAPPSVEFWQSLIHPDDRARLSQALEDHFSGRAAIYECENRLRLKNGQYRWNMDRGKVVEWDQDGKPLRMVGTDSDITGRKQAEFALQASERAERERAAELAALLDAVPAPIFIAHDRECLHITGNRAADELLRNPRGAEASLTAPPPIRPRHFRVIKNGRELLGEELPAQVAARGIEVEAFEETIVFDDGTTRDMVAYAKPLWDEKGGPRGSVLVMIDITERKRVEQALAESKQRLASIVDSAFDAIISFDAAGRIILFNAAAAAMFGCAASEALGRSIDRFIPAPFGETRADRPVTGRGGSEESFRAMARAAPNKGMRENGEEFPIEASISRVQVGGSALATVILRDVTDRQRLEREVLEIGGREQLRIGQELHDDVCQWLAATEFLANSLARDLAKRSPADVASARKLGSAIRQALTRARNLAHGLAPAVIESMGLGGALRELARDAGEMSNTRCGYRGSEILPALDPGVALHLYRIAQEAVSNAIRHGRAKKIALSLLARKDSIVLRIRDNGCGIPMPLLHHSGIGLRTMQYRADVIGATIVLRPGPAGGTEVECVLPIPPAKQIGSG